MTEININVEGWKKSGLSFSQFTLLTILSRKDYALAKYFVDSLVGVEDMYVGEIYDALEEAGWIKIHGDTVPEGIVIRQQFLDLVISDELSQKLNEIGSWIQEYRDLFRATGKAGAMGDRESCLTKMTKFISKYPEYTKEQIIKATQFYISTQAPSYRYLQQADYFIAKRDSDGTIKSRLAGHLEETAGGEVTLSEDFSTVI